MKETTAKKNAQKILAILLGLALLFQTALPAFAAFSDVSAEHQYAADIKYIEEKGFFTGSTFHPEKPISRGDYAAWILKNSSFKPAADYKPKIKRRFADMVLYLKNPNGPYIYKLVDLGVIEIPKGRAVFFKPNTPITRREALKWLFDVEGVAIPKIFEESEFRITDVNKNSKYAPLFHKAFDLELIEAGKARPKAKLTRSEAAHFVRKIKQKIPTLNVTIIPTSISDISTTQKFNILGNVWDRVVASYLHRDDVNQNNLMYGAIEGMVKELGDPHSTFERPGDNAILESLSGEVEGIGAVIQMVDEKVVVVTPIIDSPAERAGLHPDDQIVEVDDTEVAGLSLTQVVARIKGKKGTTVKIKVKREKKMLTFNIVRDVVKIKSVTMRRTDDNIAVITLTNFGENTAQEFGALVTQLKENAPRGIIIDMRNNPGGFLSTAVYIAGYFVKNGEKVTTIRYPEREDIEYSIGGAELASYETIIITNKGSASAAEILAGSLQDFGIARVVGETTFGKGTVQELIDLSDGSTLKLTVAEWLTAKGRSIEKKGITPDVIVKMTEADREAKKDPQMDKALEEIRK